MEIQKRFKDVDNNLQKFSLLIDFYQIPIQTGCPTNQDFAVIN